jgi:hypothetical protein
MDAIIAQAASDAGNFYFRQYRRIGNAQEIVRHDCGGIEQ